jgi:hypothetical protein
MTDSGPLDFAKYKRPQFEGPMHKLTRAPAAESDDGEMPAENLRWPLPLLQRAPMLASPRGDLHSRSSLQSVASEER